ncbi:TPA: hypothetical protein N0F65_011739 [Lagenidium giganteum]|uniref:Amino acid permease/ SLC12A domain-containing protein n=1 Tax=Lagenidium giganteum TaxID=4803 RepID=A0AAV2YH20_9STRA|nr:TPA: hypothetical protein N0F65_011739 [Lagenidium giganteum]
MIKRIVARWRSDNKVSAVQINQADDASPFRDTNKPSSQTPTLTIRGSTTQAEQQPPTATTPTHVYTANSLDIWMLGITIVIGGQYFSWNSGLSAGVYSYLAGYVLVATAYVALCCCNAEITGALPFAGGAYGLSRCTLGFLPGFLIGCCESLQYIAYVASTNIQFTEMLVSMWKPLSHVRPLMWLLFYVVALAILIRGGRQLWLWNFLLGGVSLGVLLLYVFGSMAFVDYRANAVPDASKATLNGFTGFIQALPLATWFFVGVEALGMSGDDVAKPKTMIPKAQVGCILTLVVTGALVYFVTISLPVDGGIDALQTSLTPLNTGFMLILNASNTVATALSLPATFATGFGFIWCYGKLIYAMSCSKLLPGDLSRVTKDSKTPYMALIAGSVVGYFICFAAYFVPAVSEHTFIVCITSAFCSYMGQSIGYILLRRSFNQIKSSAFYNPFGIFGAIYSMCVWMLGIVSVVAFQGNGGIEIGVFMATVSMLFAFYMLVARKRQVFSSQEHKVLLVAHISKFNQRKRQSTKLAKSSAQKTTKMTVSTDSGRRAWMRSATKVVPINKHTEIEEL